jgi:hypothetical protein
VGVVARAFHDLNEGLFVNGVRHDRGTLGRVIHARFGALYFVERLLNAIRAGRTRHTLNIELDDLAHAVWTSPTISYPASSMAARSDSALGT